MTRQHLPQVSFPLNVIGGISGRNFSSPLDTPCRTNKVNMYGYSVCVLLCVLCVTHTHHYTQSPGPTNRGTHSTDHASDPDIHTCIHTDRHTHTQTHIHTHTQLPREIPLLPWHRQWPPQMLMAGVCIYVSVFFVWVYCFGFCQSRGFSARVGFRV